MIYPQLFGNKPCEAFAQLTTETFVDRFLSTIKASGVDTTAIYIKHVALLVRVDSYINCL